MSLTEFYKKYHCQFQIARENLNALLKIEQNGFESVDKSPAEIQFLLATYLDYCSYCDCTHSKPNDSICCSRGIITQKDFSYFINWYCREISRIET